MTNYPPRRDRLAELAAERGGDWARWLQLREWPQGPDPATVAFDMDALAESYERDEEHYGVRQIAAVEDFFHIDMRGV
ncbi:hypothetical protein [Micromonospora sp. NPDC048839]|uniref:hypothetical protein n=1 Tax=Micromonospora sp. NPDC048839 TaxID=3155641 RepID=UPI0033C0EE2F